MTINEALNKWRPLVRTLYSKHDAAIADFELETIAGHVFHYDRVSLVSHGDETVNEVKLRRFIRLIKRRIAHEPLSYIIGRRSFFNRNFITDKRALIPRPETELLVEHALHKLRGQTDGQALVLDIGTGSGAIAVTIALEHPGTTVIATDSYRSAINLARTNAKELKAKNIRFLQADLFNQSMQRVVTKSQHTRLLVIANLPYLPVRDKRKLSDDVVKYEPSVALFAHDNGMALIKKFILQLRQYKKMDARAITILMEIDEPQSKPIRNFIHKQFPDKHASVKKDANRRDRMIELEL